MNFGCIQLFYSTKRDELEVALQPFPDKPTASASVNVKASRNSYKETDTRATLASVCAKEKKKKEKALISLLISSL